MKRLIILCLLLSGCTQTSYFVEPFAPVTESLEIDVHIVASWAQLPRECRKFGRYVRACAYPRGEIWILGEKTAKGIEVENRILGHELQHLLNWQNQSIRNPDEGGY